MKRLAMVLIIGFFIVAGTLLLFASPPQKTVSILTVPQGYARLIASDEETIGIVIYADQEDSFLTDLANIENAYIYDNDKEMIVTIKSIAVMDNQIPYKSKLYYAFRIDFQPLDMGNNTTQISFRDATIEITYTNTYKLTFNIGNIDLIYDKLEDSDYLDMFRLYGVINPIDGVDSLAGIVIGLSIRQNTSITITDMTIFTPDAELDWNEAIIVESAPMQKDTVASILENENYQNIVNSYGEDTNDLSLLSDSLIFIPIQYFNDLTYLYRFPIMISYMIGENSYKYYIDDFLFRSFDMLPEVLADDIVEIVYRY
ncbi:MAG: hypothetical protein WC479_03535 [Candidatus Izemoplasmatales bacterium]|jgi:hypothetical protein